MKKKKLFSKVTLLWYATYFLLIFMFVVSIGIVFGLNQSVIKKYNDRYCNAILSQISENAKEVAAKSRDLYSAIVNYSDIDEVMEINSFDDYYKKRSVKRLLQNLSILQGDVDFYIYVPHTDTILSQGAYHKTATYYRLIGQNTNLSYEEWMSSVLSVDGNGVRTHTDEKNGNIIFSEKYVASNGRELLLVTKANETLIFEEESYPQWMTGSDIYISTLKGNIYMSKCNSGIEKKIIHNKEIKENYGDEWSIVETTEYSAIPMIVTLVYSKKIAWEEVSILNKMQMYLFVIMLLFCAAIIFFSIKRNYTPILSILDKLNIQGSKDEFKDIEKGISELINEYRQSVRKTEQFSYEHKRSILSECLVSNYSVSYTLELLEKNNISFSGSYFTLCGFEIDDIGELFGRFDNSSVAREQKFKELIIILNNIFDELLAEKSCHIETVTVADEVFLIIIAETEEVYQDGSIYDTLCKGIQLIKEHFFIEISFSLSELYPNIGYLSKAYNQCRHLLQYKTIMRMTQPIRAKELQLIQGDVALLFDSEAETKLIKNITIGDLESAEKQISYMFSELSEMKPPLEQVRCLMIDLGCVLYKIPQQAVEIDYGKILECSKSKTRMQEFLLTTIREIGEKMHVSTTKVDRVAEIKMYIDRNYREVMDLNSLANLFGISTSYLSRHFKKVAEMSLPDYINKTRLLHAKDMLKNTDKPIKDIALKVGYENLRSFNRIFQKYEGMPPSHWRNNNK